MGALPIVPEHSEEFGWQHDIAIFPTFALFNPDDHALAVDRGGFEADGFGNPQTGRVTHGQDHAVLQIVHRTQETRDFVLAQDDRELLRLTAGGDVVFDDPRPFEGDGEEKPERGDGNDDRTGREASLLRQMNQIRPDFGRPEKVRRLAKMAGEPNDLCDVHALRVRCQVADLHIIDHPTAKRAHGQLLCEMDSATWRRRIVSRLSCQTRGRQRATSTSIPNGTEESKPKTQNYREAV
jgi:transposase